MLYLLIFWIVIPISLTIIGFFSEKKSFNNGVCPICGKKLTYFATDSHGSRGYKCISEHHDYYIWVSYNFVDKWQKNLKSR